MTGCQTGGNDSDNNAVLTGNVKTQGVYTTIALPNSSLEMSAAEYTQKKSFGPGEMPAAVVLGYGYNDQQQTITLELIESDTGRSLMSRDYYASAGNAMIQPLPIRLGGNYKLDVLSGGASLDTWQFTVTRTNSSGFLQVDNNNSGAAYGQGLISIDFDSDSLPDIFAKYDERLIYKMLNAVTKEESSITNETLFTQRFPGKVVMHCRLDSQGNLSQPKILENTLDDDCAAIFRKALLDRSPYDAWPEDVHQKFGSDSRELTLTVNFD